MSPELVALAREELSGVLDLSRPLPDRGFWVRVLAREPCCGSRVVLNLRRRGDGLDDEGTEAVLRSLKSGQLTRNPAVLPVRRFGCTDQLLWFTEPATEGRPLDQALEEGASPSTARVLHALRPVVEALETIHDDGLAHGALSPWVLHRDADGRVRVRNLWCDRHLLRAALDSESDDAAVAYAPPEIVEGREPEPRSDQYALAALVVRAVSGSPPGSEGGPLPDEIPDSWRAVLLRALHPRREERYGSVVAFWRSLVDASPPTTTDWTPSGAREAAPVGGSHRAEAPPPPDPNPILSLEGAGGEPWVLDTESGGTGRWSRILGVLVVLGLFAGATEFVPDRNPRPNPEPRAQEAAPLDTGAPGTDVLSARGAGGVDRSASSGTAYTSGTRGPSGSSVDAVNGEGPDPSLPTEGESYSDAGVTADRATVDAGRSSPTAEEPSEDRATPEAATPGGTPAASPDPNPEGIDERTPRNPGTLFLGTYPWGRAYLDGVYVGNTPVVGLRIYPGSHTIRVERPGFETYVREVEVEPDEVLRLATITLREESS